MEKSKKARERERECDSATVRQCDNATGWQRKRARMRKSATLQENERVSFCGWGNTSDICLDSWISSCTVAREGGLMGADVICVTSAISPPSLTAVQEWDSESKRDTAWAPYIYMKETYVYKKRDPYTHTKDLQVSFVYIQVLFVYILVYV